MIHMTTFEKALKALPAVLAGGLDDCQHKTVSDLDWLAQHEIDLADEGEIELSARDRRAVVRYRAKLAQMTQ